MRECFGNYPNTTGFPCICCEDKQECQLKNYFIPKDSEVEIQVSGETITTCHTDSDMTIHPDSLLMHINGSSLLCTDNKEPVKKKDSKYIIKCYWQNAYAVEGNTLYESIQQAIDG